MKVGCYKSIIKQIYESRLLYFASNHFMCYRYWLSVGAQPSDPVQRLLFRAGILPPPPMVAMGRKGGPRDTRPVDPLSGRVMMPDLPTKPSIESGDQENKS